MYCSGCGQPVDARQQACAHCGKPLPLLRATENRVQRHLRTAGTLWMAYAVLQVVQWMIALPFLSGFIGGWARHHGPWDVGLGWQPHFAWWVPLVTAILIGRAILYLVTGYALLRRERWGRTLAIVTAFLTLLKIPFGTALAIFTLWLLLPSASGAEYDGLSAYPAGPRV